jgi:asparagine synthase (glutamine-hydrolysing)
MTEIAGGWRPDHATRERLLALAPVVADRGPLLVVGSAACAVAGDVTAIVAGRLVAPSEPAAALARAYASEGDRAFGRLRGEWAAVVWDAGRDAVVLARDPLGGRSMHHHGTAFGVEARDVLSALPATPAPDRRAVGAWLAFGVLPEHGTLYAGVARLGPGQALALGAGAREWWAPRYRAPEPAAARPEALRAAVDAAVARATPAGERAGVLLSGGLDSAIVAAAARATRPGAPPLACSATFPADRDADESGLIDVLTRHLRLDAIRSVADWGRPLLGGLRYLAQWRLPSTSPNTFLWLPLLERAAAEGVTAMLDGQGGDELFDQRPFYLFADLVARGRLGAAWRLTLRYPGVRPGVARRHRARIIAHFVRRGLAPPWLHRRLALRRGAPGLLLAADARAAIDLVDEWSWLSADAPRWWAYRLNGLVRVPHLLDAAGSLRRTAALAGLSDRHPLMVDPELVAYALTVPPESSFDPRFDRPLARASQAGRLPDAVRLRPEKSGFSEFLATSLRRGDAAVLADLLDPGAARVREFVDGERLRATVAPLRNGGLATADSATVWQLAALECWLRQLERPAFATELAERYGSAPVLEHRMVSVPATST